MIKNIEAIYWKDAVGFQKRELSDETFCLLPLLTIGIIDKEDKEKLRIVSFLNLESEDTHENTFMNIPKSWIIKRKNLGNFNTTSKEVKKYGKRRHRKKN